MAYAGMSKKDVESALHTSDSTVGRILDGSRPNTTWDELWAIADACAIPRDWFSADLTRLSEIVTAGEPRFGTPQDLRDQMEQRAEAQILRVRKRTGVAAKGKRGPRRKAQ